MFYIPIQKKTIKFMKEMKFEAITKNTISWSEKNKDNYFDYIFPCSKANEQRFLLNMINDSQYKQDVTKDYPQAKVSVYCAHPFYSPPSNIIFSNFKSRSIKREQTTSDGDDRSSKDLTNSILSTFLSVVKNPAFKKQDISDFRYYLFDLCIFFRIRKKIDDKKRGSDKEGFINEANKRQFIFELNRFC